VCQINSEWYQTTGANPSEEEEQNKKKNVGLNDVIAGTNDRRMSTDIKNR
jgi:hypothetical protein